jgi:thiol peroxidase
MAQVLFKGNPIHTVGELPKKGEKAPAFTLSNRDLSDISLLQFLGKKIILDIFLSLDTDVCATGVRKFNAYADKLVNTAVLCISADLPFAAKRFCEIENLKNIISCSTFRHPEFGKDYGLTITEGPLTGLLARAVFVIDEKGIIQYQELVPEITQEPNYENVLKQVE